MRRVLLRGEARDLETALDLLHLACDVHGVVERDREAEVWFDGVAPSFDRLAIGVDELPNDAFAAPSTGFELDAVIQVSPRIVVRPPWVAAPLGFCGTELIVPRGMAFGSGEHGSTQAALLVLDALWSDPAPRSLLDVGTGSGILAAFGARRGATVIAACDVESASVAAARELLPGADVRLGGPEVFAPARFDAVVANLDAHQLGQALDAILTRWNGVGPLVLSGLRPGQDDAIVLRMTRAPSVRMERLGYVALGVAPCDVEGA